MTSARARTRVLEKHRFSGYFSNEDYLGASRRVRGVYRFYPIDASVNIVKQALKATVMYVRRKSAPIPPPTPRARRDFARTYRLREMSLGVNRSRGRARGQRRQGVKSHRRVGCILPPTHPGFRASAGHVCGSSLYFSRHDPHGANGNEDKILAVANYYEKILCKYLCCVAACVHAQTPDRARVFRHCRRSKNNTADASPRCAYLRAPLLFCDN